MTPAHPARRRHAGGRPDPRSGTGPPLPVDPDLDPTDPSEPARDHRPAPVPLRRSHPGVVVAIAVGGFLGALARYEFQLAWPVHSGRFPSSTLVINTSGAFLLGLVLTVVIDRERGRGRARRWRYIRLFACVGVLGAWTTMSTVAVEADALVRAGNAVTALAYLAATMSAGVAAVAAGTATGRLHRHVRAGPAGGMDGAVDGGLAARGRRGSMTVALAVALAGSAGAVARFLTDGAVQDRSTGAFPFGTLTVNCTGSFILGALTALAWYHGLGGRAHAVVGVGFCGAFTTWSSVSWETVRLAEDGLGRQAVVNLFGGVAAALVAAAVAIVAVALV